MPTQMTILCSMSHGGSECEKSWAKKFSKTTMTDRARGLAEKTEWLKARKNGKPKKTRKDNIHLILEFGLWTFVERA